MIGLGFFFAIFLYIALGWAAARWLPRVFFKTQRARTITKFVTAATFVLIPTWDIIPGKLYFNHLCNTEGGIKIYKTVEGVEGFYYEVGTAPGREVLDTYGYKFVEGAAGGDTVYRYTLDANGRIVRKDIDKPVSRYGVKSERHPPKWNTKRHEKLITDRQTKDILAVRTQFEYLGNWLQQKFNPLLGGGASCKLPPSTASDFYLETLKPVK